MPAPSSRLTASWLASLPARERQAFLNSLTEKEAEELSYRWEFWARDNQLLPEGDWQTWALIAGRGFGKSRTGAEAVRKWVEDGQAVRIALVARTAADARDVMVEGESGLLAISPPWNKPKYKPSQRRLTWPRHPKLGVSPIATTYSGDKPDQLRGPHHDKAWADELAAWRYEDAWDQLSFGLRLGDNPQTVVTTTPRPTKLVRELLKAETTVATRGTTYENRGNLAKAFLDKIVRKYEGTRLGRQELNAEILDDNPFALRKRAWLDAGRLKPDQLPELQRVVVAIDPSVHDGAADPNTMELAEAGIVVAGAARVKGRRHGYVLDDASTWGSPLEWARIAVQAYQEKQADRIIAEVNNGGAMVELTVRTVNRNVSYRSVHASRGKYTRAEPVSALYEQGLVHHVGCFPELEDELCNWMPGEKSPNRLDALVWALTDLMLDGATDAQNVPSPW